MRPSRTARTDCQRLFTGGAASGQIDTVLWQIRLPRIFAAVLVGAALSAAGAAYQGLFRNR